MKNINTLIPDIYSMITSKEDWFTQEISDELSKEISTRLVRHYSETETRASLRLSQMGARCPKALWHSVHTPELAEDLPAPAKIKYGYGHIIEAMAIALAKAAGHTVEGEQDELWVEGVPGHRDCIIDGCLVDVKSTSSRSFSTFKEASKFPGKGYEAHDTFGYLEQLDAYLVGSSNDDLVKVKDKAYILAIDKQLGHMCLYEHHLRKEHILERIRKYARIAALNHAPSCECGTVPDGKSGNIKLDTRASYSLYKHCCFPSLRTFLYSDGPRYLTKVERLPDVPEINPQGKLIFR